MNFLVIFSIFYFTLPARSEIVLSTSRKCLQTYSEVKNEFKIDDFKNTRIESKLVNNHALDFMNLFSVIEENYAPLVFKTKYQNFDWNQIKRDTLIAVKKTKSDFEIFKLYSELLFKFNDAHVSIIGPSSLSWQLPLQLDYINGKFLVNFISKDYPNSQKLPQIGDQIITINGTPIDHFISQFPYNNSHANELTNKRLFAVTFSKWYEMTGLPLSFMNFNKLDLEIKSKDNTRYTVSLDIKKEGVGFKQLFEHPSDSLTNSRNLSLLKSSLDTVRTESSLLEQEFSRKNPGQYKLLNSILKMSQMISPSLKMYLSQNSSEKQTSNDSKDIGTKIELGGEKPTFKLPDDFKKIETKSLLLKIPILKDFIGTNFFYAGYFKKANKKVGYLRIPSYAPSLIYTILPFLRYTIHELEKNSDYLIIDQANNPGGYVILSDWIIHALTGKYNPDKHLKFAAKPSISFMQSYAETLYQINEMKDLDPAIKTSLIQRATVELEKIRNAYKNQSYLTEPLDMTVLSDFTKIMMDKFYSSSSDKDSSASAISKLVINYLFGIDVTKDYFYSKPVYFITNELDFSGGDATPASLQDYGRVKIIGTRTAGAGGTVEEFQMKSFLNTTIHLTTSLMVRTNGNLVENYGVKPDVIIERTEADLINQNKDFFEKVLNYIKGDLEK